VATHEQLIAAIDGRRGVDAADRLCEACVVLLDIDAAAISLVFDGANSGTLGSSGVRARIYDELQFTLGEGPCLDSVLRRIPILIVDLGDPEEARWPAYRPAMLAHQIRGVYAIPVVVAGEFVGALDLFRARPGPLLAADLAGAVAAAELAAIPLLDLLDGDLQAAVTDPNSNAWAELNKLTRAELSQAIGMLVTGIARDILDRRLKLEAD
jgi:GAF domain-containing protein